MIKPDKYYFGAGVFLFITELSIALFVRDRFVRPFVGDVLAVVMMYCFLKAFVDWSVGKTTVIVLLIAFSIEVLQFFGLVRILGLEDSRIARTVLGTTFVWSDFVAYVAGAGMVLISERLRRNRKMRNLPNDIMNR